LDGLRFVPEQARLDYERPSRAITCLGNFREGGVKTYCFGHDCFEGDIAPYPMWSVATGKRVLSPEMLKPTLTRRMRKKLEAQIKRCREMVDKYPYYRGNLTSRVSLH
jgi:hypothetical protein